MRKDLMRNLLCSTLLVFACTPAGASDSDIVAAMRGCAAEKNGAKRLACYDEVLARPTQSAAATPSPAGPAAAAAVETSATPQQGFGYRGEIAREELDRQEAAKAPVIEELTAKVTAISFQPYGEFVITLDNDQVWTQKQTDTKVRPRVGDSVTIKAGTFGSFMLVTQNGRSTRVSRVR